MINIYKTEPDNAIKILTNSKFRSKFVLSNTNKEYIDRIGFNKIKLHAGELIRKRLAPYMIENDGRQTPYKGHPVFIAQHATATCCRSCLNKWYGIPKNRELTTQESSFIVKLIIQWIKKQI